ncbi:MAG TPA: prepilin-type N-terminal cleavage/methylation domain-containing protein [Deltaproteobacteria bacterium]|nr:prepilin-type N-terminal cleavage/methylation domain-containing protein [Deltaproteobacteria bacterium]HOM28984.1 prepilin-type N-terminal cleavage/methylation domain-containing protein [Deltaproteobacteria bacterium]HPP79727.1 prepilin-type N-terminal cleavage/methylation domain-containing protein [Deltaproteobacteria bacterium]
MLQSKKGFTLIELMIVVAIIGILAAIAIPAYSDYTKKSKVSEVSNSLGAAMTAAQAHHSDTASWPADITNNFYTVCQNTFGVTLPTTYCAQANWTCTSATATELVLQATLANIGTNVDGTTLILTSGADGGTRTWSGTLPQRYRPRQ